MAAASPTAFTEVVLSSPEALWIVPAALGLLIATTAFTEEFFFRGLLQRFLTERTGSVLTGIAGATIAFSLYHVPYAYLLPSWPSAGSLVDALRLGFVNGVFGGVVFGVVFARSRGSLVPVVDLHAAVDWIPAIRALGEWVGLVRVAWRWPAGPRGCWPSGRAAARLAQCQPLTHL